MSDNLKPAPPHCVAPQTQHSRCNAAQRSTAQHSTAQRRTSSVHCIISNSSSVSVCRSQRDASQSVLSKT